jgi:transposase-like protein
MDLQERASNIAVGRFADEVNAQAYLEGIIWPNGARCPHCGQDRVGKLNGATTRLGTYKCYGCRKAFNLTHGTIFSGSHVPLHKWLQAIYLTDGGTTRVGPYQLGKILNVSIKTAAHMMHRLSDAAASPML